MSIVHAYAADAPGSELRSHTYDLPTIGPDQVDIKVEYCGICHSDYSMWQNHWGISAYPFIPGHEVVGTVEALGSAAKGLTVGQRVGLGWFSGSCMHCITCMSGDHNLCPRIEQTMIGRPGGFADRVRCNWEWAIPLPNDLNAKSAGPLFCGGITVFNPIVQFDVQPTHRVGVIGIGGLGHLALQFLSAWGCDVTAFTSTPGKEDEARKLGAHHVVNSRDSQAMEKLAASFDFILNTANVSLDWNAYINALGPRGRLHMVGAVPEPVPVAVFSLLTHQREISGSPLGSPATTRRMLEFAARHAVAPVAEYFDMKDVNKAMAHLHSGKARYRIVLTN